MLNRYKLSIIGCLADYARRVGTPISFDQALAEVKTHFEKVTVCLGLVVVIVFSPVSPSSLSHAHTHTQLRKADGSKYKGDPGKAVKGALHATGVFVQQPGVSVLCVASLLLLLDTSPRDVVAFC